MKTPKKNITVQKKPETLDNLLLSDLKMLRGLVNEKMTRDSPKVEYVFGRVDFANRVN